MSWPPEPLEFVVSRHAHLPGARLSLRRSFGNIPFDNSVAAEAEAHRIANGRRLSIERRSFPALPTYRALSCKS